MRLRTSEVAAAVGGRLHGADAEIDGALVDSRRVRGGELFVPIVAARDGHEFIDDAVAAGVGAYLTAHAPGPEPRVAAVMVDDTATALLALGGAARARLPERVVGITGSVGKTSTKDLLAATLGRHGPVAASEQSFNNELGVPLTLLNAPHDAWASVVEMGARGHGHIAVLCEVARPTVGVVTNVGWSHTEALGSIDGVAKAKAELVAALPGEGTAVLNADDEWVAAMASIASPARVLTFGLAAGDVRAVEVRLDDGLRASFRLRSPWGEAEVRLKVRGAQQVPNALAAGAAALALGVGLDEIAAGLATATPSAWRMDIRRTTSGVWVINDAYNANPASMAAALRALTTLDVRRRTAVLGPMLELGAVSAQEHARIGALTHELGIDRVIAVGTEAFGVGTQVTDWQEARKLLGDLATGDAVLVKASRAAGLERLAEELAGVEGVEGQDGAWSPS